MTTSPKHLGKYELQVRLGQGGMAEVWKGFDPQLKRMVAIKFLHANLRSHPDFTNRFVREGQAIAALHHPNIVQVYDFQVSSAEDENPMAYMVMDYIEGSTLADYLQRTSYAGNFPSPYEIVHLFASISQAIDYAHQQHMIHRDIKPANILLDWRNTAHNPMGEPILTDFGIVKMLGTAAITSTGVSMGTPLYISPEQVHGKPGNEKSDIYALGVILYEICAGQPPYSGDNPYVILAQRISGPPGPPSNHNPALPPAVDAVILRCLAMDPEDRFPTACQLTVALAEAFELPVPDVIRHTVYLSPLHPNTPSSPLAYHTLPIVEAPPVASATDPQIEPVRNSAPLMVGNDTLLSDTGATSVSTPGSRENNITPVSNKNIIDTSARTHITGTMRTQFIGAIPNRYRKHAVIMICIVLLLVLISASVGTYTFWQRNHGTAAQAVAISVGSAVFLSSEQPHGQNALALNDEIQVRLHSLPNPAPKHLYYAWLQDNRAPATALFLGALHLDRGNASLAYVDGQHRDLLALANTLLVTEQFARTIPKHLARNKIRWRYIATIPHTPSSVGGLSYLDHVRHLLVSEPTLERLQLHNGLDFWLLNMLQNMYVQIVEMRDANTSQDIRLHLAHILTSLDGVCAQQEQVNMPIGPASTLSVRDCARGIDPSGYFTHVEQELVGMINAPAISREQVKHAIQALYHLNTIRTWLEQIHTDVLQIVHLDAAALMQSQAARNMLVLQMSDVIGGRFDPTTQVFLPGIVQIDQQIASIAIFTVFPYKST